MKKELEEKNILANKGEDTWCNNLFMPTKIILLHYEYIWTSSLKVKRIETKVFFANSIWWGEDEELSKYWKKIEL